MTAGTATGTTVHRQAIQALDGPFSSLAVNCFQFGCCLYGDDEEDDEGDGDNHSTWMSQLLQVAPDVTLRQLRLVASHDSASYSISRLVPFSAVGVTQHLTILQQLRAGVRYLDLRLCSDSNGGVVVCHGALRGTNLSVILDEIVMFLNQNPKELLILEVVAEYGQTFLAQDRVLAFDMMQLALGSHLYREEPIWSKMRLADMVDHNTRVCILLHPRIFQDAVLTVESVARDYGYHATTTRIDSRWHNTRNVDQLLEWNLEQVQQGQRNQLLQVNQFVLTPGVGSLSDVAQLLVGASSLRPTSLANALERRIPHYMTNHARESWNVVMMDSIRRNSAFVDFMIGLNFGGSTLKVLNAVAIGNGDREPPQVLETTMLAPYLIDNKVLYLPQTSENLGLEESMETLVICYELQDQVHVLQMNLKESQYVVISLYHKDQSRFGIVTRVNDSNQAVSVNNGGSLVCNLDSSGEYAFAYNRSV